MNAEYRYKKWITGSCFDKKTKEELLSISDDSEIEDRFYKDLDFGTGGLRGLIGAGTNRINKYTIQKTTYGLAKCLLSIYGDKAKVKGVCIAYDSRNFSETFAMDAACVLAAIGIKAYLFDRLTPTPELSFAVNYIGCIAGIVITASHNPKEYNGYKVYDEFGCQITLERADEVKRAIDEILDYSEIPILSREAAERNKLLLVIGNGIHSAFIEAVLLQSLVTDISIKKSLKIIYTPLHGAGNIPVASVLLKSGFCGLEVLESQREPDGNFSTLRSPNPEERDALSLGIEHGIRKEADIVIGTDPDCDRVGVAVKDGLEFKLLTGNQIGALLVDFVLNHKKKTGELSDKSTVIKTIVTSELGAEIAKFYGVKVIDTLTGFKFIGEKITEFDNNGDNEFIMGYEESYGYLVGTHAKDKDAVVSSLLICEMAAFYKAMGKNLMEALFDLYIKYGFYKDHLDSFTLKGINGIEKTLQIMRLLRTTQIEDIAGVSVREKKDYHLGIDGLPKADVIKLFFEDGSWLAARPSGTEPKIKFYYSVRAENQVLADEKLKGLQCWVQSMVESEE